MSDNDEKKETRQAEQQDLVHQQQILFDELSQEKAEAEKDLETDQKQSAKESDE